MPGNNAALLRLLAVAEAFLKRKATIGELRKAVAKPKRPRGGA